MEQSIGDTSTPFLWSSIVGRKTKNEESNEIVTNDQESTSIRNEKKEEKETLIIPISVENTLIESKEEEEESMDCSVKHKDIQQKTNEHVNKDELYTESSYTVSSTQPTILSKESSSESVVHNIESGEEKNGKEKDGEKESVEEKDIEEKIVEGVSVKDKVDILVVDTAAFIKQVNLHQLGKELWTIPEVLEEVRDKRARSSMAALPFEVKTCSPEVADVKAVVDFAKKTGDYASLSAVDMKVLALTYMWERLRNGIEHLRKDPVTPNSGKKKKSQKASAFSSWVNTDDDSSGWITPENLHKVKEQETTTRYEKIKSKTSIGCFTTDFSMQNVCVQMGLNLLSVDGLVIKRVTLFTQSCRACFAIVKDLDRKFCPQCGNHSLYKVRYTVDSDGEMTVYRRKLRTQKGSKYTIPPRKGGKWNSDIILREDVYNRELQKRGLHRKKNVDVMDPDHLFFGKVGVQEKLVVGYGRQNPNESRGFRTGRKKKKNTKMQY